MRGQQLPSEPKQVELLGAAVKESDGCNRRGRQATEEGRRVRDEQASSSIAGLHSLAVESATDTHLHVGSLLVRRPLLLGVWVGGHGRR